HQIVKEQIPQPHTQCALHLDKLERMDYSSVYMVVDKLLRGRKLKGAEESTTEEDAGQENARTAHPAPPAPKSFFFDEIPESVLAGKVDAFEILKNFGIEEYQRQYQLDDAEAEREIGLRIEKCEEPTKKMLLEAIRSFYRELRELTIPGIVSTTVDPGTGEVVQFPAVHQKVGARFILTKKRALIADEMGLGKTAQAIIAKNLIDQQEGRRTTAVVVVPNNVLPQWHRQIGMWNTEEKSIAVIASGAKDEAVRKALEERPDFVLVSYDMVFRKSNGSTVGDKLAQITDYLILDEVHNAKEAGSLRSKQVMGLSIAAKYVTMLSGTPVPNRVSDMGVIASILWNHEFEPEEFNRRYRSNPRVVRERILPNMLRRRKRETFGETKCARHVVTVPMTKAQQRAHERLALNKEGLGSLAMIAQLRRCALDPALVGLDEASPKYRKLIEMLVDHHDGKPAVVFSSELKEGVLDKLCAEISGYGLRVARIDGDPERSGANRERILDEFTRGEYDVIVATLATLGEGVNQLTCASRAYFIDVPFTEARLAQGITRLDRKGQKNPVDIYLMVSDKSIDSLLLRLIEQKKMLGEFLIDGMELTDQERQIIDDAERLVESGSDVLRKLYRFFGTTTNRRSEEVCRLLADESIGQFIAEQYWENFEGSFYGNTMNLIVSVIEGLEKGGKRFENALDIASGPCCLARAWGKPVTSLDANKAALDYGKNMLGEKAGDTVHASFTDMPLQDSKFDLAVFSLGLLHSAPEERETILREMNRVLDVGGVAIITTPSGEGRYEKLAAALPFLGFGVLPQITGTAQGVDKNDFECMIISAVKTGPPQAEPLPVDFMDFHKDIMESESWEASVSRKIKRRECTQFEIDDLAAVEAGEISAGEAQQAEAQTEPNPELGFIDGDPIAFLKQKYGGVTNAVKNAPDEELASLGVERTVNRKSGCFGFHIIEGMKADHAEFMKRKKKGGGNGGSSPGRLAV
ncbi:MAG: SNF2-related protein, partial [Candidatus Micrarchaeota archaeon]